LSRRPGVRRGSAGPRRRQPAPGEQQLRGRRGRVTRCGRALSRSHVLRTSRRSSGAAVQDTGRSCPLVLAAKRVRAARRPVYARMWTGIGLMSLLTLREGATLHRLGRRRKTGPKATPAAGSTTLARWQRIGTEPTEPPQVLLLTNLHLRRLRTSSPRRVSRRAPTYSRCSPPCTRPGF